MKNFITLNIDEFRTSIIHCKENVRCENLKKTKKFVISDKTKENLEKLKKENPKNMRK